MDISTKQDNLEINYLQTLLVHSFADEVSIRQLLSLSFWNENLNTLKIIK